MDRPKRRIHRCVGSLLIITKRIPDPKSEVDDAVAAASHDPTGGRGVNGSIAKKLDEGELDDVVRSAV